MAKIILINMKLPDLFRSNNKLKAQAELFAIIGIVVIVAAVAYYSYQSGLIDLPPITSISEEQRLVKESVSGFITSAAFEELRELGETGGVESPTDFVSLSNNPIPYWSRDGVVNIPDMKSALEIRLKEYLEQNKDDFAESFGKDVTIGNPIVQVSIFDERIDISINMPTSVNGQPIPQPYKTSFQTNFGKAYDFSKKFVQSQNKNRFLEMFTMVNVISRGQLSEDVPIRIVRYECGDIFFKSWDDIKPEMESLITLTLANTYTFGKSPKMTYDKSPFAEFEIPSLNGKMYTGIDVTFHEEDDFGLDRTSFFFDPEPILVVPELVPLTGSCTSTPTIINYSVRYPAIVRVKDGVTGNILQFAVDTYIKNNKPGNFGRISYELSDLAALCNNPVCSAKVSVTDLSGNPVPEASVSFLGCEIGKTSSSGIVEGPAACGAGNLRVYARGYSMYEKTYAIDELADASVTVSKMPVFTVYLHMVNVQKGESSYRVDEIIDGLGEGMVARLDFASIERKKCDNGICTRIFEGESKTLDNIPAGNYTIAAGIMSEDFTTSYGIVISNYFVKEDYGGETVHVYIPYDPYDFAYGAGDASMITLARDMRNLLKKCGIQPVTETPIDSDDFGICTVGFDEL